MFMKHDRNALSGKTERNILGRNQVAMTKGALYSLFLVLVLIATAVGKERYSCPAAIHTLYSRNAISLDSASQHTVRVISPDGKKTLLARTVEDPKNQDELQIRYTVKFAGKTFQTRLYGFNGEAAWSPDSHAFAVTQTEGGGGLGSRVYIFYVDESGLRKLDVSLPIEKDFGNPVKCEVAVPPNTGFVAWKADSSTLLVAAEVVPVSICHCMGTYRVYEVGLPARTILKTYSQTEAKHQFWDLLGCELRDADDRCVKTLERYINSKNSKLAIPK